MKKKVAAHKAPQQNKQQPKKKQWVKAKDFQFLKPVKFLPGFRSAKHWKRIVAMTYYCAIPFSMVLSFMDFQYFGIFVFIMLLAMPFMICSLATFVSTKDRYYAMEALIAAAVVGIDNIVFMTLMQNMINSLR